MGRWACIPSPRPLPGLSLLLLLLLASLRAQPQVGRVSPAPIALWPWAPCHSGPGLRPGGGGSGWRVRGPK